MEEPSACYKECNKMFSLTEPTMRIFCKKGCDAEDDEHKKLDDCKNLFCTDLCVKQEVGDDNNKFGAWSKFFARASGNSENCIKACHQGCISRVEEDD